MKRTASVVLCLYRSCLCLLLFSVTATAADIPAAAVARVQEFLRAEFDGAEDVRNRLALVTAHTTERTANGEDPDALNGQVFSLVGDPLVVVSAFTPGTAERDGAAVIVTVDFHLIATTRGEGVGTRQFVRASAAIKRVRYRVALHSGEWLLQNPPLPHVSAKALLRSYKSQLDYANKKLLPLKQTSPAQRKTFTAMQHSMNTLQALTRAGQ